MDGRPDNKELWKTEWIWIFFLPAIIPTEIKVEAIHVKNGCVKMSNLFSRRPLLGMWGSTQQHESAVAGLEKVVEVFLAEHNWLSSIDDEVWRRTYVGRW